MRNGTRRAPRQLRSTHALSLPQRLPRRPRRREPRRALPSGARRARRRVLHAGCVEGSSPTPVIVLSQLWVVSLPVHPHGHMPDARPRVEPGAQGPECAVLGGHRAPGEADYCVEGPGAWVGHVLLDCHALRSNRRTNQTANIRKTPLPRDHEAYCMSPTAVACFSAGARNATTSAINPENMSATEVASAIAAYSPAVGRLVGSGIHMRCACLPGAVANRGPTPERAPVHHRMISSARSSTDCGIVRPSALAVTQRPVHGTRLPQCGPTGRSAPGTS